MEIQNKKVRKAVIAAAGFGTRFLPQTKAMPKEMLPIVDKPIIQYIVEELVDAGIEDIVIVTGYHKRTIEDHFDNMSADLRANLKSGRKDQLLEDTKRISGLANFVYIRQKSPYGSGGPLFDAYHLIGDEPFIYTFADDFVVSKPSRFRQMIEIRNKYGGSVVTAVKRDKPGDYKRYGYVGGNQLETGLLDMTSIIEKPGTKDAAPSDIASVSGYLFDPVILEYLEKQLQSYDKEKGEFQIQDSMQKMIDDGHHIYAAEINDAVYYDTGNPLDYIKTVIEFGLKREDMSEELSKYLRDKLL